MILTSWSVQFTCMPIDWTTSSIVRSIRQFGWYLTFLKKVLCDFFFSFYTEILVRKHRTPFIWATNVDINVSRKENPTSKPQPMLWFERRMELSHWLVLFCLHVHSFTFSCLALQKPWSLFSIFPIIFFLFLFCFLHNLSAFFFLLKKYFILCVWF